MSRGLGDVYKRQIIDNARYLFSNYIDTSKGLEPLYNRPEVSSDSITAYKNYNLVKVVGGISGEQVIAWKIDDAANVNKMYVRAKIDVDNAKDASLIITDSTLSNSILFTIAPKQSNSDFRIRLRKNGSDSTIYAESVDLSYTQFYQIEGMIDFENNTVSAIRDNVEKPVLPTHSLPSFDVIHFGFSQRADNAIPTMYAKDIFITWE